MAYPARAVAQGERASSLITSEINLSEIVSRVTAEQIESIAVEVATTATDHVGLKPKARIFNIVLEKKGSTANSEDRFIASVLKQGLEMTIKANKPVVFTDEEQKRLQAKLLGPMKQAITEAFSIPDKFLNEGIQWTLSEQNPCGILETAAEEAALVIEEIHVPSSYRLSLTLNEGDNAFCLTASSDGIEFEKKQLAALI